MASDEVEEATVQPEVSGHHIRACIATHPPTRLIEVQSGPWWIFAFKLHEVFLEELKAIEKRPRR